MSDAVIKNEHNPVLDGNETVLVVDDLEDVRSLLNDALSSFGYSVICAEDGLDGLKKFRENKDRIQMLLLDVVMPKLNGSRTFQGNKKVGVKYQGAFYERV